ncbi:hypothetical protein DTW90_33735 [Neorhizobium sp. P12A]|uniref:hypothetical protein n=1 Tax=Neorhizobium sp. P12A TaxID=2268027 RepID=UPI0011F079FD|nr:hypothetical protein [Neorhizobium sp. P12A]KAA0686887.1 hypothetical protein DTW90_33735 [Neorhizobium sp. P12A]
MAERTFSPGDPPRIDTEDRFVADLPPVIAKFVHATNAGDLHLLLETFVEDALVNDQLHDYWGRREISTWALRDVLAQGLRLKIVGVVQHYGHSIVTAHVDGIFDKRGLPDPLVLAFYFSSQGEKIVQLIILRNHAGI